MSEFPTIKIDDAFISMVLAALSKTDGQVDAKFELIDERLRNERTRVAAETQEVNPSMASTPLGGERGAVNRSEAASYKDRQTMFAVFRKAAIAYITFREREEELAHKRRRLIEQEDAKERQREAGLYDEAVVLSDRLHAHGVHRSYLRINEEVTAILADLILWFADDTQFKNPASPWPTIIAMYADRSVLKPAERLAQKDHRSQSIAAPAHMNPRKPDPYYRYGIGSAPSVVLATPLVVAATAPVLIESTVPTPTVEEVKIVIAPPVEQVATNLETSPVVENAPVAETAPVSSIQNGAITRLVGQLPFWSDLNPEEASRIARHMLENDKFAESERELRVNFLKADILNGAPGALKQAAAMGYINGSDII